MMLDRDAIVARAAAAAEEARGYLPQDAPATLASAQDVPALLDELEATEEAAISALREAERVRLELDRVKRTIEQIVG